MSYPKLHNFNEMYTPPEAIDYIEKYLPKHWIYWEMCYGQGHLAKELTKRGFKVIGRDVDCFLNIPEKFDCIITNPPFNGHNKFIEFAIKLKKPFVFLIRLEHLGGVKIYELLKDLDFSIVIPKRRIHYLTSISKTRKKGTSPFHSIWLLHGIETKKQINYEGSKNEK